MNLEVTEAARIMGGRPVGQAGRATGASIDTRTLNPGDLFFALKGEVLDGHGYVADSLLKGASAAVVSRDDSAEQGPVIVVQDVQVAMTALASWVRDTVNPVVVGITGSTGKTSVKDLLAGITGPVRPTVASRGSFNNELGLPLTLLRIGPTTEVVICEMGARGPGQIRALCELARPHVGVVTNVGVSHFETFGSREAIARAKYELVQALPEGGAAVLNADDPVVAAMSPQRGDSLTFGLSADAWLKADNVSTDKLGRPSFRMVRGPEREWVTLNVSGRHQVHNALAAAAAALALGLTLQDCRTGLESAQISAWRMQVRQVEGVAIVNDAYNASPASVSSALSCGAAMVGDRGRLVAVLGYMAELGELEESEHLQVGALAAATAHRLIVVGERAEAIARGARAAGLSNLVEVATAQEAPEAVGELHAGDVLLVKGSRVAALENVAGLIENRLAGA